MENRLGAKAKNVSDVNEIAYEPPVALKRFCMALLSEQAMGNKEKAQEISGVDKGKFYYAFHRNDKFRTWYSEQCDKFVNSNEGLVSFALMREILRGEVPAIRTFYEIKRKINQPVNGKNGAHGGTLVQVIVKFPEEVSAEKAASAVEVNTDRIPPEKICVS